MADATSGPATAIEIGNEHSGAFAGEQFRDGAPDAVGATRHNGYFVLETHTLAG